MAKRVYHWKHGWIPLDHVAAKEKGVSKVEYRLGAGDRRNSVTAHLNGDRIGEMAWHKDGHIIWTAVYDDKNRRQGIASGMLAKALERDPSVRHNYDGGDGLTAAGRAFADATPISKVKAKARQVDPPDSPDWASVAAAANLDKIPDAKLLDEIKRYRQTDPNSKSLKILLREAYHRGLNTRGIG